MAAADIDGETGSDADGAGLDRPVDPRSVAVWRWSTLAGFAAPFAAITIAAAASTLGGSPAARIFWIAWPLLLIVIAVIVWRYPPARYRHLRYRVDDVGITIQDGVVWRTQSALPRIRIQHTDVFQGPLQRHYGVATLKLYTAGSRYTRTELPGLEYAAALALRDRLQRQVDDDAV